MIFLNTLSNLLQPVRASRTYQSIGFVESLEARQMLSGSTLRVVSYNIAADVNGVTTADPAVTTVLKGIGDWAINGSTNRVDVVALQETTSNAQTVQPLVNSLNAVYGNGTYAMSGFQGQVVGNSPSVGNGPNAIIYDTTTVSLIESKGVAGTLGYASGMYRQVTRYLFQPIGGTTGSRFYVYVSHAKSGGGATNEYHRGREGDLIRNDADALPAGSRIIYAGDFNAYNPSEVFFTEMMASGLGKAYDPLKPSGISNDLAGGSSTLTNGPYGLRYRLDYQLVTGNVINDTTGLQYVANSYQAFGNNGSLPAGSAVTNPNNSANTALKGHPNRNVVMNAIGEASDHLPVVADYSFVLASDPTSVTLQAETATLSGGTVKATSHTGYTGTGFADYGNAGSAITWSTSRAASGNVRLDFRYANGSTTNRTLSIVVNGNTVGSITQAPTGSWTTWKTQSITVSLKAGSNTIKATATASVGGANVDSLTIVKATTSTAVVVQAEAMQRSSAAAVGSQHKGYTGSGYVNLGSNGNYVQTTVNRTTAGNVTIKLRYANGSTTSRPISASVNGSVKVSSITMPGTGSWTTWKEVTFTLSLVAGNNVIKLTSISGSGVNLDSITIG